MPELPPAPSSLVDFVLRHLQVEASHGTLQHTDAGYELKPRVIATYNLIYTTRGRPVWVIDDEEHPLAPGRLLLVPPGVRHCGYSRTRSVTLVSLHVHARLPGGQDAFKLLVPPRVQDVQPRSYLAQYLRGMIAEYERLPPGSAKDGTWIDSKHQLLTSLQGWSQLIIPEIVRDNAVRGLLTHRAVDPLIAQVLDELNNRLDKPTELHDLAEFAGFSPQHLNRVFRKVLGVTPLKYLMRMRMQRAAALLEDGRFTVKAIAQQIGIQDPYYFSRLFREHTGHSPAQYREATLTGQPTADSKYPS